MSALTSPAIVCSEEGCPKPRLAQGLCQMHYNRVRRHGHTGRLFPSGPCPMDGCERPIYARGLCALHHNRQRHGIPADLPDTKRQSDEDRFWARVDKSGGPEVCWPWTVKRSWSGYGRFWSRSKGAEVAAHRVAWELTNGPIPPGKVVRHKCDNPPCCNPADLELGVQADNVRDMYDRGRGAIRITADQIVEVRRLAAEGRTRTEIEQATGMAKTTVGKIIHREGRYGTR